MPDPAAQLKAARREARELRRHLMEFAATAEFVLAHLDQAMEGPSTPERGRTIARLCGVLEFAKDSAAHFGLGVKLDGAATARRYAKLAALPIPEPPA